MHWQQETMNSRSRIIFNQQPETERFPVIEESAPEATAAALPVLYVSVGIVPNADVCQILVHTTGSGRFDVWHGA